MNERFDPRRHSLDYAAQRLEHYTSGENTARPRTLSEDDIHALVAKWLREDPEICAVLDGTVDKRLDRLATEMRTNEALRPSPLARGVDE